ncbi:hypothetical protein Tco_0110329 [Tanacetum coccineum]
MSLWKSQMEDHTSDWLKVVLISRLGQTMNGRTYWCVLCYRLGVPLVSVLKPWSACSKTLRQIFRKTMMYRVMDKGLDVCVDLTGLSPLTQTGMTDFVLGSAVIEAAQLTLLKRIRKFFMTQDIGARIVVHIFKRIKFAIDRGVGAQIISRLPTNFL